MTQKDIAQIQKIIKDTIQVSVNGKIDKINTKLDTYILEDNEWKAGVMPTIESTKKVMDFASVGSIILKAIVLIGATTAAIIGIINLLKK